MRSIHRVSLFFLLFALMGLVSCASSDSGSNRMVCQHTIKFEDVSDVWIVRTYEVDCDSEDYPEEATLKIRNNLDRNISIDLNGPSHYEFSIGDRRSFSQMIQPGNYSIMASSPGLRYIPENYSCSFNDHCVYEMEWVKGTEKVKYRE